jgi:hypothetical protein
MITGRLEHTNLLKEQNGKGVQQKVKNNRESNEDFEKQLLVLSLLHSHLKSEPPFPCFLRKKKSEG